MSRLPAQGGSKLLIDDFDYLLGRGQALQYFSAKRAVLYPGSKILHHLKIYIRFQKGQPYLAQSIINIVIDIGQTLGNPHNLTFKGLRHGIWVVDDDFGITFAVF